MLDYIQNIRRLIGNTKILVPGVRALIFDREERILLQKQALFGSWALPHGCVDVGESALDAVRREIFEETGLTIRGADLFGIYTDPKYSITYPNGDEVQTFSIAFLVTEWNGVLRADGDEVEALGFYSADDLPTPFYPVHADTVEDLKSFEGTVVVR